MTTRRDLLVSGVSLVAGAAVAGRLRAYSWTPPAEILIMRHAEEPGRGADIHLNDRGRQRAAALARLFPSRFATPNFLFAARASNKSNRPVETLAPLAASLGLRIDDSFADENFRKLADLLLNRPVYAGSHVLICWHHATIPGLAVSLGVQRPPRWPDQQYDHVWRLRFDSRGVSLTDDAERLLPGDGRVAVPARAAARRS